MNYYHVAPASYEPVTDLRCYQELEAAGEAPAWKWEEAEVGFDGDVVCLFERLGDAEDFQAEYVPDGVILAIDLTDAWDVQLTTVSEGYPAARRRIPARYISEENQA